MLTNKADLSHKLKDNFNQKFFSMENYILGIYLVFQSHREYEQKLDRQKDNQQKLITHLKLQLEDLERYAAQVILPLYTL